MKSSFFKYCLSTLLLLLIGASGVHGFDHMASLNHGVDLHNGTRVLGQDPGSILQPQITIGEHQGLKIEMLFVEEEEESHTSSASMMIQGPGSSIKSGLSSEFVHLTLRKNTPFFTGPLPAKIRDAQAVLQVFLN